MYTNAIAKRLGIGGSLLLVTQALGLVQNRRAR